VTLTVMTQEVVAEQESMPLFHTSACLAYMTLLAATFLCPKDLKSTILHPLCQHAPFSQLLGTVIATLESIFAKGNQVSPRSM